MKSHPLIMQPHSVRAMLAGIKTETRRIPTPRNCTFDGGAWPKELVKDGAWKERLYWKDAYTDTEAGGSLCIESFDDGITHELSPRIQPGDEIYVKEAVQSAAEMNVCHEADDYWIYKATDPDWEGASEGWKWRSPLFMPREAARIVRPVLSVGFEWLHDITGEGAIAEGVSPLFSDEEMQRHNLKDVSYKNYLWHGNFNNGEGNKQSEKWDWQYSDYKEARLSFSSLWESINAKRGYGWDTNPIVLVIKFGKENV